MEVDKSKSKPKSLWTHLFQQVEEQSVFCDVTVKVNSWSRKYHWCVLSTSPFFSKLYESRLQEQQTGIIQLNCGTSNSVKAAIHFLYGQRPKINIDNVESILEAAEFLMIEELKALCIKKLNSVKIDEGNCLNLLKLSSQYNFHLERLSDFIVSHLDDLLSNDEMLLLDKESVRFIITDPMLSYVSREDCFRYLVRWTGHFPDRNSDFSELLAALDTGDISLDIVNSVSLDGLSERNKRVCTSLSNVPETICDVLIAYPPKYAGTKYHLYAYNLNTRSWHQMSVICQNNWSWPNRPGVILTDQITYVTISDYNPKKLIFYNIQTMNCIEKSISTDDEFQEVIRTFDYVTVSNDKTYFIGNFTVNINKHSDEARNELDFDLMDFIRMQSLFGGNQVLAIQALIASKKRKIASDACSLYVSAEQNDENVVVKPLLSIHGTVKSICATDDFIYLLLPGKGQMIAYAYEQKYLKNIDLSVYTLDEGSFLCSDSRRGVYIVTKSNILQIDIQLETSSITANVFEFTIPEDKNTGDYWSRNNPTKFEILQDKIVKIEKCRDTNINKVSFQSLPEKVSCLDKEETLEIEIPERICREELHFLQTSLPKQMLRCPIGCPHCKYKETGERGHSVYERDSDSDEYVYYDDDDDDYYRPAIYYYDSSDDIIW